MLNAEEIEDGNFTCLVLREFRKWYIATVHYTLNIVEIEEMVHCNYTIDMFNAEGIKEMVE